MTDMAETKQELFPRDTICPVCPTGACLCGDAERYLRLVIEGGRTLSEKQRAWCIGEADSAGEGAYQPKYAPLDDAGLARWTLDAWTDYARSQGMY